ncbi:MAG: AIR synthase-related protein, partial [Acidobacteriota bacterium]
VSLYNETNGEAIYPTPIIGVVGVLEDASRVVARAFRAEGDEIVLLGENFGELGGSEYLKVVHQIVKGQPPQLNLNRERALIAIVTRAAAEGLVRSAHDCSDGGVAVTLAECAFDSGGIGLVVDVPVAAALPADSGPRTPDPDSAIALMAILFGESASRVVLSARPEDRARLLAMAAEAGVPAQVIGRTGGARLEINVAGRPVIDCGLAETELVWAGAIERHFAGRAA